MRFPKRRLISVFPAGEMENHGSVFVAFAPRPVLGGVIFVFKADNEVMLVAGGRRFQVSRALIVEAEFFYVVRRGHHAHARLIVSGAVMHQRDAVAVELYTVTQFDSSK
jgi:hypothetical protein